MAIPTTRQQFKDYCLRAIGAPVVEINVDTEQVDDRIDEALLKYRDYHYDGTERVLYKYLLTSTDLTNKYLTLEDNIIGVTRIFDVGESTNIHSLFNLRYQIRMNDLYDFAGKSYVPYVMAMRHIETLQETFVGKKFIRYNRHMNRLFIDFDWNSDVIAGEYVIIDCYRVLDPNTWTDVWNDPWLKKYATSLIKRQWGANMSKFQNIPLLGGLTMDGKTIYKEGVEEIEALEKELNSNWSLPSMDLTG